MNLPQNFLEDMKTLLGKEYGAFLASYEEKPMAGLRVNTGKLAAGKAADCLPWKLAPVPWIPNGFYYEEEESPARHPYYHAGLYYLQEPSAMTPASLLPVEPGDRVLDLCAAPGGKATELGARLEGKGVLFANDISNSRAKALLKNLELFGIPNIMVTSEDPEKLLGSYPEYFDKILIDAPCSGEGMFRKDGKMVKSFEEHGPEYYAEIQKRLIVTAAGMLRPGGMLLYSTCTFSPLENEEVILHLLEEKGDFCVVPVKRYEGFDPGIAVSQRKELENCVRIWPHRMKGEGHFAALLRKGPWQEGKSEDQSLPAKDCSDIGKAGYEESLRRPEDGKGRAGKRKKAWPEEAGKFLKDVMLDRTPDASPWMRSRMPDIFSWELMEKEGRLYLLPGNVQVKPGIRYLRTGLYIGDMVKGKFFEPSQALAMVLSDRTYASCICLNADDPRTVKYLKGETLDIEGLNPGRPKGWQLVCVDGWPLGWGKLVSGTLKNKYYPGWRWQ